jgi:hypothetical protein
MRFSAVILAELMRMAFGLEDSAEEALARSASPMQQASAKQNQWSSSTSRRLVESNAICEWKSITKTSGTGESYSVNDRPNE